MSAQHAAHIVPVGVLWEMIRTMMPWLQLYTQILTNMKKRYCTWYLFIHIKTLILVNVYALSHVQELAFNEEENDRNKQVLFYFCFADTSFISTFMWICCDVSHQIFPHQLWLRSLNLRVTKMVWYDSLLLLVEFCPMWIIPTLAFSGWVVEKSQLNFIYKESNLVNSVTPFLLLSKENVLMCPSIDRCPGITWTKLIS